MTTPRPVALKAAVLALVTAVWNLVGIVVSSMSTEVLAAGNIVIGAAVTVWDLMFLQNKVTPTDGLKERLESLSVPE